MQATTELHHINGRAYRLTKTIVRGGKYRIDYELTGARGAKYYTVRLRSNPELMFLVNATHTVDPLGRVWLTDRNGALEVMA